MISADIRKRQAGPGAPWELVLAVAVFALGATIGFAAYAGVIGPLKEPVAVAPTLSLIMGGGLLGLSLFAVGGIVAGRARKSGGCGRRWSQRVFRCPAE